MATEGQVFYCFDHDRLYVWYKNRWALLERATSAFGQHTRIREPIPPPEIIDIARCDLIALRKALE